MHTMSTESTNPSDPGPVGPTTGLPAGSTPTTGTIATGPAGTDDATPVEEREPGWITRHTGLLTAVLMAVIVAAVAIAGLTYYRSKIESRNADTEAAFVQTVGAQGATVETVECHGGTCAAVIGGQAYTVLVQKDAAGKQHFGVSAYAGR
jgi:hypothetical protein